MKMTFQVITVIISRMGIDLAPLGALDPLVVRPRDLTDRYAHPAKEVRRLARAGVLLDVAHGYYVVVPERFRGSGWLPSIESVALGIGQRDYGVPAVALMSVSAARLLGAIPRAQGHAVIAGPKQRPELVTRVGSVAFVTRRVETLDVQRADTELGAGWITTAEQTMLDLADRPALTGLPTTDVAEAIRWLAHDADWALLGDLAVDQRKTPAAVRAAYVAGVDPPVRSRKGVPQLGLPPGPGADVARYGIE